MRMRLGEPLSPETAGITFETAGISPENDQISQGEIQPDLIVYRVSRQLEVGVVI